MDKPLTVYADTNIFLQCLLLQDLKWSDIGDFDEINVIVLPTVLDELDNFNHGSGDRRSKRARKVMEVIDRINDSPTHVHELRDKSPKITIALGAHPPEGATMPHPLKATKPDHCILFEAQCLAKKSAGAYAFLTTDRGQIALADTLKISRIKAPESWRLPAETTDQDKRLKKLEETIDAMQSTQPVIELYLDGQDGKPLAGADSEPINLVNWNPDARLTLMIPYFPKLHSSKAHELSSIAQAMHPMKTDFSKPPPSDSYLFKGLPALDPLRGRTWNPPSAESIADYRDREYPTWVKQVTSWAEKLDEELNSQVNVFVLSLIVANTGGVPATNTTVTVSISPDGLAFSKPKKLKNPKGPPLVPSAPRGSSLGLHDTMSAFRSMYPSARITAQLDRIGRYQMQKHDPFGFYFHPGPPDWPSDTVGHICDSLRHKIEPEVFSYHIRSVSDKRPEKGALRIQITADNLPIPVQVTIPISVTYEPRDTFEQARQLLKFPDSGNDIDDDD